MWCEVPFGISGPAYDLNRATRKGRFELGGFSEKAGETFAAVFIATNKMRFPCDDHDLAITHRIRRD